MESRCAKLKFLLCTWDFFKALALLSFRTVFRSFAESFPCPKALHRPLSPATMELLEQVVRESSLDGLLAAPDQIGSKSNAQIFVQLCSTDGLAGFSQVSYLRSRKWLLAQTAWTLKSCLLWLDSQFTEPFTARKVLIWASERRSSGWLFLGMFRPNLVNKASHAHGNGFIGFLMTPCAKFHE